MLNKGYVYTASSPCFLNAKHIFQRTRTRKNDFRKHFSILLQF